MRDLLRFQQMCEHPVRRRIGYGVMLVFVLLNEHDEQIQYALFCGSAPAKLMNTSRAPPWENEMAISQGGNREFSRTMEQ